MRTESAPTTALRGKNISEDALAKSMAIFAASYAVPQCDSLDDPGSSGAVSAGSQGGGAKDKAIAFVDAASTLRSLTGGRIAVWPCLSGSTVGGAGVGGGVFVGLADDEAFFRMRRIVGAKTTTCWSRYPSAEMFGVVSENLGSSLTDSERSGPVQAPRTRPGI